MKSDWNVTSHGLHESWQGQCWESFRIHGQPMSADVRDSCYFLGSANISWSRRFFSDISLNSKSRRKLDKYMTCNDWNIINETMRAQCYIFGLLLCLPYADYHWDCTFLLSWSLHKGLTLILVPLHRDLCYHCTIWSNSSLSVWYNLLQVQLSLVDAYRPLVSFTYNSLYVEEYINCTTRTLRP